MNATTLLRQKHRRVKRLFPAIARDKHRRLALVLELVEELMTHLSAEDNLFLSAVADETGIRVDGYRDEQALVRNAVLQVVFVEGDDDAFPKRLNELETVFDRHAHAMERDVLPLADQLVKADHLEAIGRRMQRFFDAAGPSDARVMKERPACAAE